MQHYVEQASSAASKVFTWLQTDATDHISLGHTVSCTSERALTDHEHLYLEKDPQSHIFLVLAGVFSNYKVLADGRRQVCTFAYPGDILGLDCIGKHVNNAESLGSSRVRCIPINTIDKLILSEPGFGQSLLRITALELANTREQLLSLGRKSATEKLATFLLGISLRTRNADQQSHVVQIPMKRCEIADFLGLTVETVSRNFTKLKQLGVISMLSISAICIDDIELLESIAGGGESVQIH
ncbi:MAG: CRP/FNR family transcriptional regulator [Granulosicoccus sp.]|jgi:CRP/FNR family transcriptional regulator